MFLQTLFSEPILFVRVVVIVILSIVIHELAHGVAALSQGDNTPRTSGHLTPNPVVHMGYESIIFLCVAGIAWGAMPINSANFRHAKWSEVWVAAAGPLSNVLLGTIFAGLYVAAKQSTLPISQEFVLMAARINMMLFVFNLLPIPPLDGFHVYSQFFPGLKRFENSPIAFFIMMLIFLVPTFSKLLATATMFLVMMSINFWVTGLSALQR